MRSKIISFRVPVDLCEEFEQKCKDVDINVTNRLKEFVENECHATKVSRR